MARMVASTLGSARIQPMRIPPQNDFDIEPIVIIRSVRVLIEAATGAGTGSSSQTSVRVSSMTVRVRVSEMMSHNRLRSAAGSDMPVGLWLSGTR